METFGAQGWKFVVWAVLQQDRFGFAFFALPLAGSWVLSKGVVLG